MTPHPIKEMAGVDEGSSQHIGTSDEDTPPVKRLKGPAKSPETPRARQYMRNPQHPLYHPYEIPPLICQRTPSILQNCNPKTCRVHKLHRQIILPKKLMSKNIILSIKLTRS